MLTRRKRFSMLGSMRGALELLSRRGRPPWGSARVIGAVAATLMARASAGSGSARLDIVIFTGPAPEPWNPETLEAMGMGGSETMAWELSRELVALGHRVRVFGHCPGAEGVFEGVEWLHYRRFRDLGCDVLLASRQPAAVDQSHGVRARVRLLWVHDVHCGDKLTPERDRRIDAYLCLTRWHVACFAQHHPQLEPNKILRLRNGIDTSSYRLQEGEQREAQRAIYSSCPSRGLQVALEVWPTIRAQEPGASLHVYYGFENWERTATLAQDQAALAAIAALKGQLSSTAGVVYHGRTSPADLAREFRISGVWAYPCSFHETSCITAMQAQAAGLKIVTSALAALNETVAERGVLLRDEPGSEQYKAHFIAATLAALRAGSARAERAAVQEYAQQHFDLPGVAQDFVAVFRRLLAR